MAKLLAFDFIVKYRSGKGNKATDALSRLPNGEEVQDQEMNLTVGGEAKAISMVIANWWEGLHQVYNQDPQLQHLLNHYHQGDLDPQRYQVRGVFLFDKGRLHMGTLRAQLE